MPKKTRIPKLCLHKPSGQARVQISGKTTYLGKYGTPEAEENYKRLIAEWLVSGQSAAANVDRRNSISMAELMLGYLKHMEAHKADRPKELHHVRAMMRPLRELYASLPIADFGPRRLLALREAYIARGYCRNNVNDYVRRVRRMFRWAVVQELVPPTVFQALQAVEGLRAGESLAPESRDVRPVSQSDINATLPHVSRQVAAMIQLQLLCGCRPVEITLVRACDIDMTGKVWAYRPPHHKTERFGKTRTIYFGPKAQEILRAFLEPDVSAYLFSPADADRERRQRIHAERNTSPTPSETERHARKRRANPQRKPGKRYTTDSYRRAIERGCDIADQVARGVTAPFSCERCGKMFATGGTLQRHQERKHAIDKALRREPDRIIRRWSPNQLRHTYATMIRRQHGIEAARILLGHTSAVTTEIYAERDERLVAGIVEQVG